MQPKDWVKSSHRDSTHMTLTATPPMVSVVQALYGSKDRWKTGAVDGFVGEIRVLLVEWEGQHVE